MKLINTKLISYTILIFIIFPLFLLILLKIRPVRAGVPYFDHFSIPRFVIP